MGINLLSMRTRGAAVGVAISWIPTFMIVGITPTGIANLGWRFYIIWTVFNVCLLPIVYLFFPGTADRSLKDMDRYFSESRSIYVFRDKEAISATRPANIMRLRRRGLRNTPLLLRNS